MTVVKKRCGDSGSMKRGEAVAISVTWSGGMV
jgi:hypothetical protein